VGGRLKPAPIKQIVLQKPKGKEALCSIYELEDSSSKNEMFVKALERVYV
jgi:hypothetical protein